MPSELLVETIAMLKQRIEIRAEYLSRNEIPTRQMLVDPLLRALGWDFEDTDRVSLEHPSGRGRMDYALKIGGRLRVAVEAKRYGEELTDGMRDQVYGYARRSGSKYAVVTNGDRWEMFDTSRYWANAVANVGETDIKVDNLYACAERLDRISFRRLESELFVRLPRSEAVGR